MVEEKYGEDVKLRMTGSAWKCTSCVLDVFFHLYFRGEGCRGGEWCGVFLSSVKFPLRRCANDGKRMEVYFLRAGRFVSLI